MTRFSDAQEMLRARGMCGELGGIDGVAWVCILDAAHAPTGQCGGTTECSPKPCVHLESSDVPYEHLSSKPCSKCDLYYTNFNNEELTTPTTAKVILGELTFNDDPPQDTEDPPIVYAISVKLFRCETCCARINAGDRVQYFAERIARTGRPVVVHAEPCPTYQVKWHDDSGRRTSGPYHYGEADQLRRSYERRGIIATVLREDKVSHD